MNAHRSANTSIWRLVLPCAIALLIPANPTLAEDESLHYGIDIFGNLTLLNFGAEEIFQAPGEDPWQVDIRRMTDAKRARSGLAYLVAIPPEAADIDNPTVGWRLYSLNLDPDTPGFKSVVGSVPLDQPLSAIAFGQGDTLYGVTFKPARFVRVDLETGAFKDTGHLNYAQTEQDWYDSQNSALVYHPKQDLFYWIPSNVEETGRKILVIDLDNHFGAVKELKVELEGLSGIPRLNSGRVLADGNLELYSRNDRYVLDFKAPTPTLTAFGDFTPSTYFGGIYREVLAVFPADDHPCIPGDTTLCLGKDWAYEIEVEWTDPHSATQKAARARKLSPDSGAFWFVDPGNLEILIKVLDTCAFDANRWVFGAASTDLEYEIIVREYGTGLERRYSNLPGQRSPAITDVNAFPCG